MFQHRWRAQLDVSRVKCIQLLVVLPIERRARHHRRTAACCGALSSLSSKETPLPLGSKSWRVVVVIRGETKQRVAATIDRHQRITKFGLNIFTEISPKCQYTYVTRHAVRLSGLFSRSICSVGTPSALRSAQRAPARRRALKTRFLCFVTGIAADDDDRHAF